MYQSPKSATTAGLLGIFLGSVGAHNWYLGDKKKGIIHVSLFGAGILFVILGLVTMPKTLYGALTTGFSISYLFSGLGYICSTASGGWGLVEGIIILSKGDAGLAAMGIPVAAPVVPNNNMGGAYMNNGMNNGMPMNNGMNNMGNMNNGMPMNNGMNNGMGDMNNNMGNMNGMNNGMNNGMPMNNGMNNGMGDMNNNMGNMNNGGNNN